MEDSDRVTSFWKIIKSELRENQHVWLFIEKKNEYPIPRHKDPLNL